MSSKERHIFAFSRAHMGECGDIIGRIRIEYDQIGVHARRQGALISPDVRTRRPALA